jgi:hypothetical protein
MNIASEQLVTGRAVRLNRVCDLLARLAPPFGAGSRASRDFLAPSSCLKASLFGTREKFSTGLRSKRPSEVQDEPPLRNEHAGGQS